MLKALKKSFPPFYYQYKCILINATLFMSIPFLLTGVHFLVLGSVPSYRNYYYNSLDPDVLIVNTIMFIVTYAIPLATQLSSLIFGYIRRRYVSEYKLEPEISM